MKINYNGPVERKPMDPPICPLYVEKGVKRPFCSEGGCARWMDDDNCCADVLTAEMLKAIANGIAHLH